MLTSRDRFCVSCFQHCYKAAKSRGLSNDQAFAEAVVLTGEKRLSAEIDKNPGIIKRWQRLNKRYRR